MCTHSQLFPAAVDSDRWRVGSAEQEREGDETVRRKQRREVSGTWKSNRQKIDRMRKVERRLEKRQERGNEIKRRRRRDYSGEINTWV